MAAAFALPTTAQAAGRGAISTSTIDTSAAHPAACFCDKIRPPDSAQRIALWDEVRAKAGFDLMFALEEAEGRYWNAYLDRFIEAMAAHMPLLAPAIRATARHTWESGNILAHCCDEPMA